jgi:hypothetical protein
MNQLPASRAEVLWVAGSCERAFRVLTPLQGGSFELLPEAI